MEFDFDAPVFCNFAPNKDLAYFDEWNATVNDQNSLDQWFSVFHQSHYVKQKPNITPQALNSKVQSSKSHFKLPQESCNVSSQAKYRTKGEERPKTRKRKQISSDEYQQNIQNEKNIPPLQKKQLKQRISLSKPNAKIEERRNSKQLVPSELNKRQSVAIPIPEQTSNIQTQRIKDINEKESVELKEKKRSRSISSSSISRTKMEPIILPNKSKLMIAEHACENSNSQMSSSATPTVQTINNRKNSMNVTRIGNNQSNSRISLDLRGRDKVSQQPLEQSKVDFRKQRSVSLGYGGLVNEKDMNQQQLEHRRRISTRAIPEECSVKEFERKWEKMHGVKMYMLDYQKRKEIRQLFLDHSSSPDRKS